MTETHDTKTKLPSTNAAVIRNELHLNGIAAFFFPGRADQVIEAIVEARTGEQWAESARQEAADTLRIVRDELSKSCVRWQIVQYTKDLTLHEGESGAFKDSGPVTYHIAGGELHLKRDGQTDHVFYYGPAGLDSEELEAFHTTMNAILGRRQEPLADLDETLARRTDSDPDATGTPAPGNPPHPSGGTPGEFPDEPSNTARD